jgi:V/A-type H+-transporting ATPase subunit C
MKNVAKFAALNTKIRVLERELLTKKDYLNLIGLESVEACINYFLEETYYSELLKDLKMKDLSAVENLFYNNLLEKYDKITSFLHIEYRKIFKKIFMRYEVEHIKKYLRKLNQNKSVEGLYLNFEKAKYSDLNYKILSSSKNMKEFVEALEGTDYYKILYYHLSSKDRLFYMEMSLDIHYFNRLNSEMEKRFGQKKRNTILEILQKNSDLLNIQWIYRGKKYYEFSSEELLNYVLLTGYYFKYKDLKSLCYAKTTQELINKLKDSKYSFLFTDEENFEFLMERNVERYIYKLFKDLEKVDALNINKSIGYMHKLEYEMRDIFTILESINYGLEVNDIKEKLVREVKGG